MAGSGHGTKAVVAALFANLGIAIAKFVAFAITGASSMLAEAVHSCADSGNQALLLYGGRAARREPDETHPFGYGRARYFWSFVVALVLFALGSLFALYEGVEKLRHPHQLTSPAVAVTVLVVGIALETWSFRTAIVEANAVRGSLGWWQFVRRSRLPELPVVLLEDLGALVGLVLALVGVSLSAATGDPVWDALGTVAIGVLLFVIAAILVVEMKGMLLGEGATEEQVAAIRAALVDADDVTRVIHLRTLHLGPEELLVAAKVELTAVDSAVDVAAAINAAETRLRAAVPVARRVYLEPDVWAAAEPPAAAR